MKIGLKRLKRKYNETMDEAENLHSIQGFISNPHKAIEVTIQVSELIAKAAKIKAKIKKKEGNK
jgi:hypothetical protein